MINGDISNQFFGYDPHAAHMVRLQNGGLIMAGTSISSESSNANREAFVTRIDPCSDKNQYDRPLGSTLVSGGNNCSRNYKWSHKTNIDGKHETLVWLALSPDESYVLAAGTRSTRTDLSKIGRYIKKLDAATGAEIWNTTLSVSDTQFGSNSGLETIAFTDDGGFIVGGYAKGQNKLFPTFKSGGQVEDGLPMMQKFSASVANARFMSKRPDPEWTWICGVGNNCSTGGSMKAIRTYMNGTEEMVVGVPGVRTALSILNTANGDLINYRDIDNTWSAGLGTSNDVEVDINKNGVVTGFITTGLDFRPMDCPPSREGNDDGCERIGGHISKISPDLSSIVWNTRFNNFDGGIGSFSGLTAASLGDAVVLTECWGIQRALDAQGNGVGWISACGQGIEHCDKFSGAVGQMCENDPRRNWRGTSVGVRPNGSINFYRMDSFVGDEPVLSSAFEYAVSYPGGVAMLGDETMGFGVANYKFDRQVSTTAAPTTTTTRSTTTTTARTTTRPTTDTTTPRTTADTTTRTHSTTRTTQQSSTSQETTRTTGETTRTTPQSTTDSWSTWSTTSETTRTTGDTTTSGTRTTPQSTTDSWSTWSTTGETTRTTGDTTTSGTRTTPQSTTDSWSTWSTTGETTRTTGQTTRTTQQSSTTTTRPTPEPFDPSGCPDEDGVVWVGNAARVQYQSETARFMLVNILKRAATFNVRESFYTGFGILARKYCGADMMNAVIDGRVRIDMYDKEAVYTVDPQRFLRNDGSNTHVSFAFGAEQGAGINDAGNTKKDQIFMSITGLDLVDWGKKDVNQCLDKMAFGVHRDLYEGELGCVAWNKIIW